MFTWEGSKNEFIESNKRKRNLNNNWDPIYSWVQGRSDRDPGGKNGFWLLNPSFLKSIP